MWNQAQTSLRKQRSRKHVLKINIKAGKRGPRKDGAGIVGSWSERNKRGSARQFHTGLSTDRASCQQYLGNIAQRPKERALSLERGRN